MEKHPSMARLYKALENRVGQSDLARSLGVSPQTVNNWEARGISKDGALDAQRKLGVSAVWLLHDEGPMTIGKSSQSQRPDAEKIAGANRILHDYLAYEREPSAGIYDVGMIGIVLEFVEKLGQPVTADNVVQFVGRFRQVLAEGEAVGGKRLLGGHRG